MLRDAFHAFRVLRLAKYLLAHRAPSRKPGELLGGVEAVEQAAEMLAKAKELSLEKAP